MKTNQIKARDFCILQKCRNKISQMKRRQSGGPLPRHIRLSVSITEIRQRLLGSLTTSRQHSHSFPAENSSSSSLAREKSGRDVRRAIYSGKSFLIVFPPEEKETHDRNKRKHMCGTFQTELSSEKWQRERIINLRVFQKLPEIIAISIFEVADFLINLRRYSVKEFWREIYEEFFAWNIHGIS